MHDLASSQPAKVAELSKVWQDHFEEFRATALKDMPPEAKPKKAASKAEKAE